jgi:hypothetical protein
MRDAAITVIERDFSPELFMLMHPL